MADDDKPSKRDDHYQDVSDTIEEKGRLVPVSLTRSSMIASYAALFSCLPIVGIIFAIIAIIFGSKTINASIQSARGPRQGLTRAWFGVVMGIVVLNANIVVILHYIFILVMNKTR
ncbi:MAG: hypothetical protein ACRCZF_13925 [Gemmataceae bacterium]